MPMLAHSIIRTDTDRTGKTYKRIHIERLDPTTGKWHHLVTTTHWRTTRDALAYIVAQYNYNADYVRATREK